MKPRWHQRLIVRLGAGVLLAEVLGLTLLGWWLSGLFAMPVDRQLPPRLAAPDAVRSHGAGGHETLADDARWRDFALRFSLGSVALVGLTAAVLTTLYRSRVGRDLQPLVAAAGQAGGGQISARVVAAGDGGSEFGVPGRQLDARIDALEKREKEWSDLTRFQRAILDQAAYAIIATDPRGVITAFNRTAERMLGYTSAELIGRQTPAVFHDPDEVRERAAQYSVELGEPIEPGFDTFVCHTRRGWPNEREWTYVGRDGRRLTVHLGITALRDEAGAINGYLGIARDITEQQRAAAELRRSERFLERVFRAAPLIIYVFDLRERRNIFATRRIEQVLGYDAAAVAALGDQFLATLAHPDDLARLPALLARWDTARDDDVLTVEYRMRRADGGWRWFLGSDTVFERDAQGRVVSIIGSAQDITELKEATAAVRESEERSRLILDSLREGVTVHGPQGVILSSNRSAERILGMTSAEIGALSRAKLDWGAIRPDGTPFAPVDYPIHQSFATGLPLTGITMGLYRRSGELFWISINSAPVFRPGESSPYAVVASFFDVSEQQAAVKASQERARLAELDAAVSRSLGGSKPLPETLAECLRQILGFLDAAMCRVWLLTDDQEVLQLIATEGFDKSLEGPYARIPVGVLKVGKIAAERRALLTNDLPGNPALEVSDWERREGVSAFAGFPLIADGRLLGVFGVFGRQPISEEAQGSLARLADRLSLGILRKQGEQQIQQLNAELERRVTERTAELGRRVNEVETLNRSMINLLEDLQQARDGAESSARQLATVNARLRLANEELESFSYSVSHDLRAPLRNVSGFVELLRNKLADRLEDATARYLKIIQEESQRMARLIDDLLEFSRLGRARLRTEQFSMRELVGEVFEEIRQATLHEIDWVPGPLPDCAGDRSLLRQVWVNLLNNAVKYSRRSRPARIEVGSLPADPGAREVTYFVRDNGVGFDMRYVDKLFGVFQRLHSTAEFEGTGIGLANVQRIVSRHGGRVWAEGVVGQGAAFYFALPHGEA